MWVVWFRRALLALSLIFGFSLLYVLLTRPQSEFVAPSFPPESLSKADGGMEDFTFFHSQEGVVQWEVKADNAQIFEKNNQAILKEVTITLFGQGGREMRLQGEDGRINTLSRDFMVSNPSSDLSIELEGGYLVYTNHLSWKDDRRILTTKDPVTIIGNGMTIKGVGLIGKLDVEEFQVQRHVEVDFAH